MSISTVSLIIERINVAEPDSSIVVFKTGTKGLLNAYFLTPCGTAAQVSKMPDFVGIYHKNMDIKRVKRWLDIAAANQEGEPEKWRAYRVE